jgi:hypothetical protein
MVARAFPSATDGAGGATATRPDETMADSAHKEKHGGGPKDDRSVT